MDFKPPSKSFTQISIYCIFTNILYLGFLLYGSVTTSSNSFKIFLCYKNTHSHTRTYAHAQIHKQAQINRLNKPNTFPREGNPQTHTNMFLSVDTWCDEIGPNALSLTFYTTQLFKMSALWTALQHHGQRKSRSIQRDWIPAKRLKGALIAYMERWVSLYAPMSPVSSHLRSISFWSVLCLFPNPLSPQESCCFFFFLIWAFFGWVETTQLWWKAAKIKKK